MSSPLKHRLLSVAGTHGHPRTHPWGGPIHPDSMGSWGWPSVGSAGFPLAEESRSPDCSSHWSQRLNSSLAAFGPLSEHSGDPEEGWYGGRLVVTVVTYPIIAATIWQLVAWIRSGHMQGVHVSA